MKQESLDNSPRYKNPWKGVGLFFVFTSIISGFSYLFYQWYLLQTTSDAIFVGVMMGSSLAVLKFNAFVKNLISEASVHFSQVLGLSKKQFDEMYTAKMFHPIKALLTGFSYASIISITVYLLRPWTEFELNLLLALFVYSVNVLFGMGFYALLRYFKFSMTLGERIKVKLWSREDQALNYMFELNKVVALAVAFASFSGMLSLIFSIIKFSDLMIVFSVFSLSVSLSAYVIPLIPLSRQVKILKFKKVANVTALIERENKQLLKNAKKGQPINKEQIETLNYLYENTKKIKVFPPVSEQSINTAVYVIILTMLPTLLEYFLNNIVG